MPTKLTSICQPAEADGQPAACRATFTVDGQRGNQKCLTGGLVSLLADDAKADVYHWEVISHPPQCDYLLTGTTQPQAQLSLPGSGAYVVQLTVSKGDCVAQSRVILWVATPRRLYRIPADSEALRFDGDEEWAGDLARVVQQVDWNLPTPEQKAALDAANQPGPDNPFATHEDLDGGPGLPCDLTDDEVAAIKAAQEPSGENPFATMQDLPEGPVEPCELTEAQIAAIAGAEDPDGENPFVTDSHRRRFAPTADQKAALDGAEEPADDNPVVTASHLGRVAPTSDQREALDAADDPGPCNPFVTNSHLQGYVPTPKQREAMDRAEEPDRENPFVTESRLERDVLTPDQRAAIRRARAPTWENPFVTDSHLREYSPTTDQRSALNHAQCPTGENPYVTESHLEELAPTPDQREALDGAQEPGADNPFVTERALPEIPDPQLTGPQVEAIQQAEHPSADNPFVTEHALPECPPPQLNDDQLEAIQEAQEPRADNPFITQTALPEIPEPQLSDDQLEAIQEAQEPRADNPFITQTALPEIPEPQLSDDQLKAIQEAQEPRAGNPFITQSALPEVPEPQLTDDQVKAIQKADDPRDGNPFITQSALPEVPEPQLTDDQVKAIQKADDPREGNPFITQSTLPEIPGLPFTGEQVKAIQKANDPREDNPFVTRVELPLGVSPNQKEALDRANQPNATNPVATLADLGQAGVVTRTVAAGTLDLSVMHSTPSNGLGGLEVVGILPERGVATLHFEGYQLARKGGYIIKTLPLRVDAKTVSSPPADPLGFRQFIVVQFVEFNEQGFELQMIQPLHEVSGVPALGPCMVEVSEILPGTPEPELVTLEQAVKRYYNLIQQEDYALAWPMLSERFREDRDLTFERYVRGWERSGPAILVGLHRCQMDTHQAALILDLDFPSEGPVQQRSTHLIRFEFVRDEAFGRPRFGHWLYGAGQEVILSDEIQAILDQLTPAERERLGTLREPCTPEVTAKFTLQQFERGLMWWFEHTESLENIWVLYEAETDFMRGARWHRYVDDWPKEDDYSCDEARANGPKGPVRGFGWLWCKNATLRQRVGAPVDREAGSGDVPPYSRGVFFEGGVIFFKPKLQDPVNTTNQGIILINGEGWWRLDLS